LNERVWRTEINVTVNESGYGTDYAPMEKQFPAFPSPQWLTPLRKSHICPFGLPDAERYRARRCETKRGHCASGCGRLQEEGNRDARAGGGRGAKGTKDGRECRLSLSLPRRETQGKNFFRGSLRIEKPFLIKTLHATLGPNRRRGREPAGKLENPRIAVWH